MSIAELFLIGVGLAMDAFAVSICKGLAMTKINKKQLITLAVAFGGFQALMPAIGYFLGNAFISYIEAIDHWVAFILLAYVGGKMIWEVIEDIRHPQEGEEEKDQPLPLTEVLVLAIATSIDAFAVGISFSIYGVNIALAAAIIGIVTFIISAAGVGIGNVFGSKYKNKAEIAGGVILICIGLRILLVDLGVL